MTRFARLGKKTEHEASSWNELKQNDKSKGFNNDNRYSEKNNRSNGNGKAGIPDWLEKRRAARRARRKKTKPCFHCRQPGHIITECPIRFDETDVIVCYKCGSSEHTVHECKAIVKEGEYPFAKCFICKETGHLSSKCPDNPRGLYPDGGGCKFCGSVEHFRRDCPERDELNKQKQFNDKKRKFKIRQENESIDAIISSDDDSDDNAKEFVKKKPKVVKF